MQIYLKYQKCNRWNTISSHYTIYSCVEWKFQILIYKTNVKSIIILIYLDIQEPQEKNNQIEF